MSRGRLISIIVLVLVVGATLAISALALRAGLAKEALPRREHLTAVRGEIVGLEYILPAKGSDTLRFRIPGQPLSFQVPSQAGKLSAIHDELAAGGGETSVLYDAGNRMHPLFSQDEDFYLVYAIERPGRKILSYEQSQRGFEADRVWAWIVLAMMLCSGGGLAYALWKEAKAP